MHLDIPQISKAKFRTRPVGHSAFRLSLFLPLILVLFPVAAFAAADRSCFNPAQKQIPQNQTFQNLSGSVPANWGIRNNELFEVRDSLLKINIDLASQAGAGGFRSDIKSFAQNEVDFDFDFILKVAENASENLQL